MASEEVTVNSVDLSVLNEVDDDTPNEGQTITYTITAANSAESNAIATNVMVFDNLPTGVTLDSANPSMGIYDELTGKWSITELAIGAMETLVITATINAGTSGMTLPNTAEIMGDETDPNPDDNMASEEVTVNSVDLSVLKEVDDDTPNEGQTITYTITAANSAESNAIATNVEVVDMLPEGITFVSANHSVGGYVFDEESGGGTWSLQAPLPIGAMETLVITATVDAGTSGMTLPNTAEIMGDETDPNPDDNMVSEEVTVNSVDLSVLKEVDDDTPNEGQSINYMLTVANSTQTNVTATNVMVFENLPSGITFVSADPSMGTYDEQLGKWTIAELPPGESKTLMITGLVDTDTSGVTLTNTVEIMSDEPDSNPDDNVDSEGVTVNSVDLSVMKVADDDTPNEGQTITYTITAFNSPESNAIATNVEVVDMLPEGITFVSANHSVGGYVFDEESGGGTWSLQAPLPIGAMETLVITATVDAGTSGMTLPNTAEIMGDETDPDPSNNIAREEVDVPPSPQTIQFITPLSIYRLNGPIEVPIPVVPSRGTISGFKWHDVNQDGVWDSDEPGRAGWRFFLDNGDDGVFDPQTERSAITRADGMYIFTDLAAGEHIVREDTTLLSDGTFTIHGFPPPDAIEGSQYVINLEDGEVVQGQFGVAETPNFGSFDFSTLIRPADDHLGHIRIEQPFEQDQFREALTPWQSFTIRNMTAAEFNILTIDLSTLGSPGDRLVTIVDDNYMTPSFPIPIPTGESVTLFAFYDPAIREGADDEFIVQQYPDWHDNPDTTQQDESRNQPHTFSQDAHLVVETDAGLTFGVNVVGGSTFDSDITYNGRVDNLDVTRLVTLLNVPIPVVSVVAGENRFDPTSDINARCPDGAEGVIDTCDWPLNGTPAREIGLGDFGPLNVEKLESRDVIPPINPVSGNVMATSNPLSSSVDTGVIVEEPAAARILSSLIGDANSSAISHPTARPTVNELVDNEGAYAAFSDDSISNATFRSAVGNVEMTLAAPAIVGSSRDIQRTTIISAISDGVASDKQRRLTNNDVISSSAVDEIVFRTGHLFSPTGLQTIRADRFVRPMANDLVKPLDRMSNIEANAKTSKTTTAELVDIATLAFYEAEGIADSSMSTPLPSKLDSVDEKDVDEEDTEQKESSEDAVDAVFADGDELEIVEHAAGN